MKHKLHISLLLVWVIAVLVSACAVQPETPAVDVPVQTETEAVVEEEAAPAEDSAASTEEAAPTTESAAASEVDVQALIEDKVAGNHDMARILNADKTREEWEVTLDRMIGYGAKITEEEKTLIIDWLLSR